MYRRGRFNLSLTPFSTQIVDCLQNKPESGFRHLPLGWFALRNRKPEEIGISKENRDKKEAEEFQKPDWVGLSKMRLGVFSLLEHVDSVRNNQIKEHMPSLISKLKCRLSSARQG